MKKILALFCVLALCAGVAFATSEWDESDWSYVNIPILKVYDHHSAYVVVYQRHGTLTGSCSIPKEWFKQGSEGQLGKIRPLPRGMQSYITVCFKKGELAHVYITVPLKRSDPVWGVMMGGDNRLPPQLDPNNMGAFF